MAEGRALEVCASADLIEAGPGVRFEARVAGWTQPLPAFAVRSGGQVYAYLNQCRHVAMELDWQPGQFFDADGQYLMCATHGALYEPHTGRCVAGPCRGQSLLPVSIQETQGRVYWLSTE